MTAPSTITIGLVQMNSQDDTRANIDAALAGIDLAANRGADLVCLPEVWTWLGDGRPPADAADPIPGALTQRLAERAEEHNIWLHAGSIYEAIEGEGRFANTTVVFNPGGEIVATYRKIHLFDVDLAGQKAFRESDTILPGNDIVTFRMNGVTVGLAICYDLRFPELFRALADRGAELIILPAAFTATTGRDHWEPLIRARAIENTVFMVAPAQIGPHPVDRGCYGRSMVVDPWGTVLAQAPDRPVVTVCDVDAAEVARVRSQIPSLRNRRPDVIG